MLNADYFTADAGPFVDRDPQTRRFERVDDWLRTGADFSYFNAKGVHGESYDLGVGYGVNLPGGRFALVFDLPLALTTSDADDLAYMVSGAVGLQYRMTPWWNVTPIVRVGHVGTFDDGALAVLYSGSVVSTVKWKVKGFDVTMGNLFGIESNVKRVDYDGTSDDYDLLVGLFENGFTVGKPIRTRFMGKRIRWQAFYRLSSYVGTDLYLDNQHAVGLRYSTGGHADGSSLEIGWAGGPDYDSLRLRVIARF
jgi:hypothetical protein